MNEKQFNWAIIICIVIGICVIGYFLVYEPHTHEGDPSFRFYEVPVSETMNKSVIHLEDLNILNTGKLEVIQVDGKIAEIFIRSSELTPDINLRELK